MSLHSHDEQLPFSPYAAPLDSHQRTNSFGPLLSDMQPQHFGEGTDAHSSAAYAPPHVATGSMLFDESPFVLPTAAPVPPFDDELPLFSERYAGAGDDDSSTSFSSSSPSSDFSSFPAYPSYTSHPASQQSALHIGSRIHSSHTPHVSAYPPPPPPFHAQLSASPALASSAIGPVLPRPTNTSPPPSSSSNPPVARVAPKKRRVRGLPPDQRIERRRAQHRAVDKNRRIKENDAIERLQGLLKRQRQLTDGAGVEGSVADEGAPEGIADEDEDSGSGNGDGNSEKVGRLTVLESSIAMIEQLSEACARMEAACNAKDAQLSRVSNHLHGVAASIAQQATSLASGLIDDDEAAADGYLSYPSSSASPPSYASLTVTSNRSLCPPASPGALLSVLPHATSSYLAYSDRSHTLRNSGLAFASTLCVTFINISDGVILDVNDRFLAQTGWRRSDLLHTSMDHEDMACGHPLSPFLLRERGDKRLNRPVEYLPQYPRAMAEIDQLIRGIKRKGDTSWRCRMGDGTVFECHTTMWTEYSDASAMGGEQYGMMQKDNGSICLGVVASGEQVRPSPDRMVLVFAIEDAVIIEKLEDWRIGDD